MEGLSVYRHFFHDILRQKKHVLSDREEELLALADEVMDSPSEIFSMFNDADIRFGTIKDENAEEIEVTKGRYIKFLESKDRQVRKDAFHTLYRSYRAMRNTLAQALSSNIKRTGSMRTSGNMSRACMQRWTGTMCLLTYMTTLSIP